MAEGGKKVTVAVTSCNKEKLEAVDSAFASHFADASLQILSHSSDSGIPHGQPWGMQHTYEGALARLHHLKSSAMRSDWVHLTWQARNRSRGTGPCDRRRRSEL
ncbi:unnamed protein product [Effrenium voratum]|uniref:Non-canonical purine NTP phosphatase/PRRC1 domain-containing protein n=1 Tax=Effrenium voratum TaxID=2562239 RepID=A0AA36HT43_9DINO|nr:unnamed protein product [Effrenium voratum]CAJ1450909.1 unnamed protein product [Effrenium voratum]